MSLNLFLLFLFINLLLLPSLILSTFISSSKNHRIDDESIKTQFAPQFEIIPINDISKEDDQNNNNNRKIREIISNKEGNGGVGIYWMSPEGGNSDFQTWSIPTSSSYGSGQQQINNNQKQIENNKQLLDNPLISSSISSSSSQQQQIPSSGPSISFHQQPQFSTQQQQQPFQQNSFSGYGQYIGGQQNNNNNGGMLDGSYLNYLQKQINTYPVMIYTLSDCIPCQRAKHLIAINYPDVRAHYLELSGNEQWQQQLQIQLQYLTGAITFPYIFVCGQYIGGGTELFELHESGQLRRLINQCLQKQTKYN